MADITQLKRYGAPRINWGKWFLIGTGMLVSAFILLVPMIYIFVQAFSKGLMPVLHNLADPDMLHAIWLTVLIALIAVPVMLSQGSNEDEAAVLLGASGWQMFRRVTLPNIRWALLYGVVLTNARAIGEFGAVSVVSGSIRGETLSLPLQIELLEQDYNTVGSFTAAALLTLMAIITLFLKSMLQWRLENQEKRAQQEENHEH